MPAQTRRTASRPSRAQRRAGVQTSRTYNLPAPSAVTVAPRRSYIPEPSATDHTAEYQAISKDLRRILIWSAIIIVVMVVLAFVL